MQNLLNPIKQRIKEGMTPLQAFLTDATCGEGCWEARELICRCSCGGKNHGCMKSKSGNRPQRTAKIDGEAYKLVSIGAYGDILKQYDALMKTKESVKCDCEKEHKQGLRDVEKLKTHDGGIIIYHYYWKETDVGSPARVKPATKSQLLSWEELQGIDREKIRSPYLLWEKL